jgi:3-oxoacyl-[acyl-carrier-protein] synthase II
MPDRAEIWITGLGAHTAAGAGVAAVAAALARGEPLAQPGEETAGHWVARAPDADVGRIARRLDRSSIFFLAAAREAWSNAGLDRVTGAAERIGVLEGSSLGPMQQLLATERARAASGFRAALHPADVVRMMFGAGCAVFAQEVGAHGSVFALSAGSTSAAVAVAEGWARLSAGLADVMVVGGAEAPLDPEVMAVFEAAGILAPGGEHFPCQPFDRDRRGTMLGEGAAVVVLETAAHARVRGVEPLAIVSGVGISGEEGSLTAPDPEGRGVTRAARSALSDLSIRQLGWIKSHGTGTRLGDAAEYRGLCGLAPHAALTSLKPLLGHCLGASGAVELVAAVLALRAGVIPPTLGTATVDPAFGDRHVALEPERLRHPTALLLSESLGGRCAAIAVRQAA